MLNPNDLPSSPPPDALQKLLVLVQDLDPQTFDALPDADSPEYPGNEELLSFRPDGTPTWWPLNRAENGGDWSLSQRRHVLLSRLLENLPADFPPTPVTPTDAHKIVRSLRHIAYGLHSEASAILNS